MPAPPCRPRCQDIFSLGCVIAELFLDGKATFDLAQLLAYRRKQYDPTPLLAGLAPDIRAMVSHMLQQEPGT
jgi:phosphoinositide-3-kinase regulatory subunit 4